MIRILLSTMQRPKRNFNAVSAAIALTSTLLWGNLPAAHAAPQTPWKIDFSGPQGVSVSYEGVPVIRRSTLYVVKPGWTGVLYDQRARKHAIEKRETGTWRVTDKNEGFHAEYELRPIDPHNFELQFRGELLKDMPAQIEFNAGYFNANPLVNRPYRALTRANQNTPKSTLAGVVPSFPLQDGLRENDLAPNFESIEFDSRLGKMTLEVQSSSQMIFADARRYPPQWAQESPIFWCGWLAGMQPLRVGQPIQATLKIHIEKDTAPVGARESIALRPAAKRVPDAFSARRQAVQIVPQPQKIELQSGQSFILPQNLPWSVTAPRGETRLTAAVQRLLGDEWNLKLPAPRAAQSTRAAVYPDGWSGIRLGNTAPIDFGVELKDAEWAKKPDAYRLKVDARGIEIVSPTARGAFYGLQTLAQLLRTDGKTVTAVHSQIEDWAALEFRGAHWYPSQSGVPFHTKLIGIMARHKFNYAVIQCEAARWDSHPEIAAPNSISKKDLRALVEWCRANFIEPIPLVNGPGHANWMFRNNQNLDLAEDRKTPYAYAVNNPKSLEFMREILSEAIEVFEPKFFHLGHDEVTMRGRFPNPESPYYREGDNVTDLVMTNLRSLHGWLAEREIETMIWGDMFLYRGEGTDAAHAPSIEEAKKRRAMLPKDVIVTDWHYGTNEKYPSLQLFQEVGLRTIGATWHIPLNIRHFTHAAINANSWGMLQTTWAGFFPDESTLDKELRQFSAFILAGEYGWSGRKELLDALPYDAETRWNRAYTPLARDERAGITLALGDAARVAPENWLGLGEGWDLTTFFNEQNATAARRFDDIRFQIPARRFAVISSATNAMAPDGAIGGMSITLNHSAQEIALLHSTLWSVLDGVTVARLEVEYSDGTRAEENFITGQTIASWQNNGVISNAASGWRGESPAGTPLGMRVTRWRNPHPQKTIARLRFTPVDTEAGYVLAGITLIN